MFLGEYVHNIDSKGRLTLPAKYRADLAKGVVITRGVERCLLVFPADAWENLANDITSLPFTRKDARIFNRFFFGGASECAPDKQGRVLLPPNLRTYANLDGETVIVCLDKHMEIWNPQQWRQAEKDMEEKIEIIAEGLAGLGIL
jgi:MraZ protein